jgi:hypothetical protein
MCGQDSLHTPIGLAAEHPPFIVGSCEKDISVISDKRNPGLRTYDGLNGVTMNIGQLPITKMSYM